MVGRAGLMVVVGFSMLLGFISFNMNRYATEAVGNMASYNDGTISHNLAVSGANAALAKFYRDTTWRGPTTQTLTAASMSGTIRTQVSDLGSDKLMLQTISSHSGSGMGTLHDTVEVYFSRKRLNSFTMFAWMTNFEGNVFWASGDTVWGRVHSNGNFHVDGKPVFMEKVTTAKGFDPKVGTSTNKAIFKNGYETGVASIDLPTDFSDLIGASTSPGGKHYTNEIWVTLDGKSSASGDGKAYVRNTQGGAIVDSFSLGDPNFDGVLLSTGDVHVEGVVDGQISIASLSDVWINNDITYQHDPRDVPSSTDMIGLIAENNVIIAKNAANAANCEIDGSIFARTGSLMAEDLEHLPLTGTLKVYGSIVQDERGGVGKLSGSTLVRGYSKRYTYDNRLGDPTVRPPHYPGYYVKTFAITNWWESYRVTQYR